MAANLKTGNLDGYCVGEPWNSLALVQRAGWIVATSPSIEPGHPEKVLLVRSDFAEPRADEHRKIISALRASCEFCQAPANRERIARTLALPKYLNTNEEAISRSLCGPFRFNKERTEPASDLHIFSGAEVNEPGPEKAAWVRDSLIRTGVLPKANELDQRRLASMFRQDIFHAAMSSAKPGRVVAA